MRSDDVNSPKEILGHLRESQRTITSLEPNLGLLYPEYILLFSDIVDVNFNFILKGSYNDFKNRINFRKEGETFELLPGLGDAFGQYDDLNKKTQENLESILNKFNNYFESIFICDCPDAFRIVYVNECIMNMFYNLLKKPLGKNYKIFIKEKCKSFVLFKRGQGKSVLIDEASVTEMNKLIDTLFNFANTVHYLRKLHLSYLINRNTEYFTQINNTIVNYLAKTEVSNDDIAKLSKDTDTFNKNFGSDEFVITLSEEIEAWTGTKRVFDYTSRMYDFIPSFIPPLPFNPEIIAKPDEYENIMTNPNHRFNSFGQEDISTCPHIHKRLMKRYILIDEVARNLISSGINLDSYCEFIHIDMLVYLSLLINHPLFVEKLKELKREWAIVVNSFRSFNPSIHHATAIYYASLCSDRLNTTEQISLPIRSNDILTMLNNPEESILKKKLINIMNKNKTAQMFIQDACDDLQ